VGHWKIRLTESLCKGKDKIGKLGFGCAFIKRIDDKRQRWTSTQSKSKPPERLEK
jgi:hypothetical protein